MRRISRISDSVAGLRTEASGSRRSTPFICQRCLRTSGQQPSIHSSPFSTSSRFRAEAPAGVQGTTSTDVQSVRSTEPTSRPDYVLASTWDGLERIGTPRWYEKVKRPQEDFKAYGRAEPITDRNTIRNELLKAIVEVFSIRRAKGEVNQDAVSLSPSTVELPFPRGVRIGCDPRTKQPIFHFRNEEVEATFLQQLKSAMEPKIEQSEVLKDIYDKGHAKRNRFGFADLVGDSFGKWSSVSLEDLSIRLQVVNRMLHRTGIRLTDPQIASSVTAGSMFLNLFKPEPAKKLAESLANNDKLVTLPNVKVTDHRVTFVHKERDLGRWKVIKEELTSRGIRPTGRPF